MKRITFTYTNAKELNENLLNMLAVANMTGEISELEPKIDYNSYTISIVVSNTKAEEVRVACETNKIASEILGIKFFMPVIDKINL